MPQLTCLKICIRDARLGHAWQAQPMGASSFKNLTSKYRPKAVVRNKIRCGGFLIH
jgi:hypothetical protein